VSINLADGSYRNLFEFSSLYDAHRPPPWSSGQNS
jgi:hypothetical protein